MTNLRNFIKFEISIFYACLVDQKLELNGPKNGHLHTCFSHFSIISNIVSISRRHQTSQANKEQNRQ